jgi:hypothetical protein
MKLLFFLFSLLSSSLATSQEKYFLVELEENAEKSYEKAILGNKSIEIEIDKGILTCSFYGGKCLGVYDIVKTSSGFVKGFNYTLDLGYLQRDILSNKEFNELTMQIANGTKFYFYPDSLASPNWHFLEISSAEYPKVLKVVRKH